MATVSDQFTPIRSIVRRSRSAARRPISSAGRTLMSPSRSVSAWNSLLEMSFTVMKGTPWRPQTWAMAAASMSSQSEP